MEISLRVSVFNDLLHFNAPLHLFCDQMSHSLLVWPHQIERDSAKETEKRGKNFTS